MSDHQSCDLGGSSSYLPADEAAALATAASSSALNPVRAASEVITIDPAHCDIFPLNPRKERGFVRGEDAELLESIKANGQQVPAVVRPSVISGRYELIVGTRRLAAIRELNQAGGNLQLVAEVRRLEDGDAWLLSETENAGRKSVSPLAQARSWSKACIRFYAGNQAEMARALGVDKSVVSRTLALAGLPDVLIDLIRNPDRINLYYAEQVGPSLNDPATSGKLLAHARTLLEQGIRLSPAEAARRLLLDPGAADAMKPQPLWAGDHPRLGSWNVDPKGRAVLKLKPLPPKLNRADRQALLKQIVAYIEAHFQRD